GESPIPTYYGDEICDVSGVGYAKDVVKRVTRGRLHRMGFGPGDLARATDPYGAAGGAGPPPQALRRGPGRRRRPRTPGPACAAASFGARLPAQGHHVVGVDLVAHKGVRERLSDFVEADLEGGVPDAVGDGYDIVLAADVFEHVRDPE